jgi:hypothetical protein
MVDIEYTTINALHSISLKRQQTVSIGNYSYFRVVDNQLHVKYMNHNQGVDGSSPSGPTVVREGVRSKRSDSFFCWVEMGLKKRNQ